MAPQFKILQFGRYFPPHIGGTENVISDLTEGLNKEGIFCDVLCCNDDDIYSEERIGNYKVIRTRTLLKFGSVAFSPQQIFKLKDLWRQYDIIHVHHPAPMATLALWLINPSCKIIIYWHSDIVRQRFLLFFFKPFQNWLLKRADAVVATTPYYINDSESLSRFPDKTTYIPLGIEGLARSDDNGAVTQLRSQFAGKKIVFSLGRLVEYKGYQYLVEAAKYLSDDYIILIGGDGRLKADLADRIEQGKLQNKVKLLGKLSNEQVGQYFELCNLFCLPSITKNEAFGLVLLEAMSLSKPIVATKIPGSGVHWVNNDLTSGINVEIEDPQAIAEAIKKILENQETENTYKKGAFDRFNKFFKKEMMVQSFVQLYHKVLKK